MKLKISNKYAIILIVVASCVVMGLVDAVVKPDYTIKSAIKILLFLLLPLFYCKVYNDKNSKTVLVPSKKGFLSALMVGVLIFFIIIAAYYLLKDVFDFSNVTKSLTGNIGVNADNFLYVAIYISFVNSFLEEFFFRGFAFMILKNYSGRIKAYIFSAVLFALYHIAMMIGWFGFEVLLLTIAGLFIGGIIFNFFNEKNGNVYMSYLIHMFANFAINIIGFLLF